MEYGDIDMIKHMLFEQQRFSIVKAKLDKNTSDFIDEAYAYAWCKGVYPIFHENSQVELYKDVFRTTHLMVDEISKYLETEYKKIEYGDDKEYISYYSFETQLYNKYKLYENHGEARSHLLPVVRYFYLSERYENMWKDFIKGSNHPGEAAGLLKKFNIEELRMY